MDIFTWLEFQVKPKAVDSSEFIYNEMESQSDMTLPIIYQPFNVNNKLHWGSLGEILDYLCATGCWGKKVLDFGPGDGWPSLLMASHVEEITGVDLSPKRIDVCNENAERLGIKNARFITADINEGLPFEDASFDAIVAASAIEQTPNPGLTIKELYRILKPSGRIRMFYESLKIYSGEKEKEAFFIDLSNKFKTNLIIFNRDIKSEKAVQYLLSFNISREELEEYFSLKNDGIDLTEISEESLQFIKNNLKDSRKCITYHPSASSWVTMFRSAGFTKIIPSTEGRLFAKKLFDLQKEHPQTEEELFRYLLPIIKTAVSFEVSLDSEPMLTIIK